MTMKWTNQMPEKAGFYWVKVGNRKKIVEVLGSQHISGFAVKLEGWALIALPLFIVDAWAGPLPDPEEA